MEYLFPLQSVLYLDAPHDSDHVSQCFHCRKVSVHCTQCQGDQVNWDQSVTVSALCEGCDIAPKYIQYTWSLYTVNASSKPVIEGKKKDVCTWICAVNYHYFIFKKKNLTLIFFCSSSVLLYSGSQCSIRHHGGFCHFPSGSCYYHPSSTCDRCFTVHHRCQYLCFCLSE